MSEQVIDVRQLSRSFGETVALDQVDLSVFAGCVFGLVGENGAGKTTLLKHLIGLYAAKQGAVRVFDRDPVHETVEVLSHIGFLSEERDLPDWMAVGELATFTAAFFANWDKTYAQELLDTFELSARQKVRTLSRGQRARMGLVLALAHRPRLLLLDEPSSGLDPVVRRDILAAIVRTVADEGRTVVFSSHLLDEVQRVSDNVAMLHRGRNVLTGSLDDVLADHARLLVRFEEPRSAAPVVESVLNCTGEGREWSVVCNGQRETVERRLAELGGEIIERGSPSLEEIFVARIGGLAAEGVNAS